MARSFSPRSECLRLDPGCSSKKEPHDWGIGGGRIGTRWIVRDGQGVEIGAGDPGSPFSAWRRAMWALNRRKER